MQSIKPFRRRSLLLGLSALVWLHAACAQAQDILVLGVVPYLSTRKLAELYEPLRAHLSGSLGRPVLLESANDYREFLSRTASGRYDIVATSPYFGRLAQLDQGYTPVARPLTDLEPLLVTRSQNGVASVADLRGKVITTSDPLANLTLAAIRHLSAQGLAPGRDTDLRATGNHANSLAVLERGDSEAAVVSVSALTQVGGDWTGRIRVLARMDPVTPLLYMAHARLPAADLKRIRQTMMTFANDTAEGKRFSAKLGHGGLKPIREQDMKILDPYVEDLKKLLNSVNNQGFASPSTPAPRRP